MPRRSSSLEPESVSSPRRSARIARTHADSPTPAETTKPTQRRRIRSQSTQEKSLADIKEDVKNIEQTTQTQFRSRSASLQEEDSHTNGQEGLLLAKRSTRLRSRNESEREESPPRQRVTRSMSQSPTGLLSQEEPLKTAEKRNTRLRSRNDSVEKLEKDESPRQRVTRSMSQSPSDQIYDPKVIIVKLPGFKKKLPVLKKDDKDNLPSLDVISECENETEKLNASNSEDKKETALKKTPVKQMNGDEQEKAPDEDIEKKEERAEGKESRISTLDSEQEDAEKIESPKDKQIKSVESSPGETMILRLEETSSASNSSPKLPEPDKLELSESQEAFDDSEQNQTVDDPKLNEKDSPQKLDADKSLDKSKSNENDTIEKLSLQKQEISLQTEDTSYQKKDTSPQKEGTSPENEDTSPQKEDTSPQSTDESLQKENTSFQKEDSFLHKQDTPSLDNSSSEKNVSDQEQNSDYEKSSNISLVQYTRNTSQLHISPKPEDEGSSNLFFVNDDGITYTPILDKGENTSAQLDNIEAMDESLVKERSRTEKSLLENESDKENKFEKSNSKSEKKVVEKTEDDQINDTSKLTSSSHSSVDAENEKRDSEKKSKSQKPKSNKKLSKYITDKELNNYVESFTAKRKRNSSDNSSEICKRKKKRKAIPEMKFSDESDYESEPRNEFLDDMAFEGSEDTPSENSDAIVDEGESLGSVDSDIDSDDDYERNSFVVDDDVGNEELLSGSEEFGQECWTRKRRRIVSVSSDSGDELDNMSMQPFGGYSPSIVSVNQVSSVETDLESVRNRNEELSKMIEDEGKKADQTLVESPKNENKENLESLANENNSKEILSKYFERIDTESLQKKDRRKTISTSTVEKDKHPKVTRLSLQKEIKTSPKTQKKQTSLKDSQTSLNKSEEASMLEDFHDTTIEDAETTQRVDETSDLENTDDEIFEDEEEQPVEKDLNISDFKRNEKSLTPKSKSSKYKSFEEILQEELNTKDLTPEKESNDAADVRSDTEVFEEDKRKSAASQNKSIEVILQEELDANELSSEYGQSSENSDVERIEENKIKSVKKNLNTSDFKNQKPTSVSPKSKVNYAIEIILPRRKSISFSDLNSSEVRTNLNTSKELGKSKLKKVPDKSFEEIMIDVSKLIKTPTPKKLLTPKQESQKSCKKSQDILAKPSEDFGTDETVLQTTFTKKSKKKNKKQIVNEENETPKAKQTTPKIVGSKILKKQSSVKEDLLVETAVNDSLKSSSKVLKKQHSFNEDLPIETDTSERKKSKIKVFKKQLSVSDDLPEEPEVSKLKKSSFKMSRKQPSVSEDISFESNISGSERSSSKKLLIVSEDLTVSESKSKKLKKKKPSVSDDLPVESEIIRLTSSKILAKKEKLSQDYKSDKKRKRSQSDESAAEMKYKKKNLPFKSSLFKFNVEATTSSGCFAEEDIGEPQIRKVKNDMQELESNWNILNKEDVYFKPKSLKALKKKTLLKSKLGKKFEIKHEQTKPSISEFDSIQAPIRKPNIYKNLIKPSCFGHTDFNMKVELLPVPSLNRQSIKIKKNKKANINPVAISACLTGHVNCMDFKKEILDSNIVKKVHPLKGRIKTTTP